MPHFSPISWLFTGFLFYMLFFMFLVLFWWMQNFKFPFIQVRSTSVSSSTWRWM